MKKKLHIVLASSLLIASLAACNNATGIPGAVSNETETTAHVETDRQEETSETKMTETRLDSAEKNGSKETVGVANPWREISYDEANETVAKLFKAPDGATNVKWSICDSLEGSSGVPGPLVQMTFDLDGMSYTAREQLTGDASRDISGMNYEWTVTDDVTLSNWADGQMEAKSMRYIGDDEWADVITWYDIEYGTSYSLSVTAKDLDGFDLQAIAEAMYDPSTQQ